MSGWDINDWGIAVGAFSAVIVILLTWYFQKRFDPGDIGTILSTFLAGFLIPVGVFLCRFVSNPALMTEQARNDGYKPYIFLSGIVLAYLGAATVWRYARDAYTGTTQSAPGASSVRPVGP